MTSNSKPKVSKASSSTIEIKDRQNICSTCGFVPQNLDERKGMKLYCSNFMGSNIKLGEVLKRIGTSTGIERTWHMKKCCAACWRILLQWDSARRAIESCNVKWSERTSGNLPMVSPADKNRTRFKDLLLKNIRKSSYQTAFKRLMGRESVKEAWNKHLTKTIRREVKMLKKEHRNLYPSCTPEKQNGEAEWKSILSRVKKIAPVFYGIVVASMTKTDVQRKKMSRTERDFLSTRMGMMINIPLGHRGLMRYQSEIAVKLWHLGANSAILRFLYIQGVSTLSHSARRAIKKKKNLVTEWCETIQKEENSTEAVASDNLHPGFSLLVRRRFDKFESNARTTKPKPGRQWRLVCQGVAVKNRISFRNLQEEAPKKACELPLTVYLPNQSDYEELKMRMQVVVERILQANLSLFADRPVIDHIPHKYSEQCAQKSEYVDLGIIEGNHITPKQASNLLQKLEDLVPKGYPVVLHGHEEMVKNISTVQGSSAKGSTAPALIPVAQDTNLRFLFMKDTLTDLHVPTSPTERATLRNLMHMFGHDGITDKNAPFQCLDDFFLFVCCAMVVGFALEVLISNEDELNDGEPETLLQRVSAEVIRRVWHQMPMDQVADIANAEVEGDEESEYRFCFCKEDREDERMLECSNINCENGNWFHELCVSNPQVSDDWYCSTTCQSSGGGQYCVCRMKTREELVWTCANKKCKRGRKFHHGCVRSTVGLPLTKGQKWYCSAQCQKGKKIEEDQELRYLEAVTWRCLFNECLRDAEREGDGEALMGYWRIYMPEIFKRGHDMIFLAAHRLLAGISGCFEPRVRQEVIHNRTMNFEGEAGKNFSFDLQSKGYYQRDTEVCISFQKGKRGVEDDDDDDGEDTGKAEGDPLTKKKKKRKLDKDSGTNDNGNTSHPISNRYALFKADVAEFQKKFSDDELFKETKGRCIPSMMSKSFDPDFSRKETASMKNCLLRLIKEYDEGPLPGKKSRSIKGAGSSKEDAGSSDDDEKDNQSEDESKEEQSDDEEDKSSNDEDDDEEEDEDKSSDDDDEDKSSDDDEDEDEDEDDDDVSSDDS